jgi:cytoskeleton protein RodZ
MTTMQPSQSGQDQAAHDLFADRRDVMEVSAASHPLDHHDAAFGSRLRAAREALGRDLETCAHALKLPLRILRKLEQGEHAGIDSKIYLASYIGKYGQYLGISEAEIRAEQARIRQAEPPLVATGGVSHSRFLFDRYATAATYLVLTLVIVVPTVWFGVRSTLDRDLSHLTPLDASPVAQQDAQAAVPGKPGAAAVAAAPVAKAPAAQPIQDQPLMASMAPFPSLGDDAPQPPKVAAPAAAADTGAGEHSLSLNLSAASWIEVTGQDGTRLEYGLLPAGSSKTWHSDQPLDVRIGNVGGAQVSIDGQPVTLDGFRHANVAHFRVQIADGKAAAASL